MTPDLWVALIIGIAPTIGAYFIALGARRSAAKALEVSTENKGLLAQVSSKVDGILTRAEDRASTAREETLVSRQETADARVAGVESAGIAHAEGMVTGAQQERDRTTK